MSAEPFDRSDPRLESAATELQALVRQHYPTATFEVFEGHDPEGLYLRAIVDVEDTDEVMDLLVDRLLELQVEQGLPVYVVPARPLARIVETLSALPAGQRRSGQL